MELRVKKNHLSAQVRFFLPMASDVIHVESMSDGIKLSSASGRDFAEVLIYGQVEEHSPINAVCSKADLRFWFKGIKAWPRGKGSSKTVVVDIGPDRLTAYSKRRPSCRTSIPLEQPTAKIIPPARWTTSVVADIPAIGMKGTPALINKGPTATPEKGVTRISVSPDQLRLVSFDGVSVAEHSVNIEGDGCIDIDLANEFLRKALATGVLSGGLVAISRNEGFAKISKDGCTLVTALAPALELETVLEEVDSGTERIDVRMNANKLSRVCKTISAHKSNYLRLVIHDDFAELHDATQLVPRDVRRIALRPNRQYGLSGGLDATTTGDPAPLSVVIDAQSMLKALKPFEEESEVQLCVVGGEEPSVVIVQGTHDFPRFLIPTPKLLGRRIPSAIHIPGDPHVSLALDIVSASIEPLAKKHVWLAQHDDQLYLHCVIEKKRESDGSQFPVLFTDVAVDAIGKLDGIVPLSPSLLEQMIETSKAAGEIDIEVGEDEVSISAEGHQRYSEQLAGKTIPLMGLTCPLEDYGTVWSPDLGRALDEILLATDTVPGAGASIALVADGRTITATAGSYTRRASFQVKGQGDTKPEVKVLWPKYFVANLARFLLAAECEVKIKSDGEALLLSGENFTLALCPNIGYQVITHSSLTSAPGTAVYLLDPEDARQVVNVIDAARTHHRDPSLFLWYDGGYLHTRYEASGGGPALSIPVQIEKGLGAKKHIIEVGGDDLKNALQSSILYASGATRIFLDIKGDQTVHIGRIGRPNFSFELSQITRRPFAKHDRVEIYAALGGQYRAIAKSLCRRVLLSHYHLPPSVKNDPESFSEFLFKNGLDHCEIMIDNGAFSARLAGVELDEQQYFAFLHANAHLPNLIQYCSNDSYFDTFRYNLNVYVRMVRDEGLDPIYIFHLREPMEGLERLVNGEYGVPVSRLGWGGAAVDAPELRLQYVTRGTAVIEQAGIDPRSIRIHGFGMVSQISLLQTVPFTTADASSFSIWAQNFQLPTPWGMVSLKKGNPRFITSHPLKKHMVRWIHSLGYEKGDLKIEFRLNRLAQDNPKGLGLRTLFGLAYYQWLEEGWKYVDILKREQRYIPMNELVDMGQFIYQETENVPRSNAGNMKPIRLTV
jgi:hypothetical protein